MKRKLIDLTLPLFSGAPIWSPEPKTVITDYFTLGRAYGAEEGMNMKVLYMSGHAGTHCDQDQLLAGVLDGVGGDRLATVAPGLVAEAGFVGQRVH